jgi:hypothetical protein
MEGVKLQVHGVSMLQVHEGWSSKLQVQEDDLLQVHEGWSSKCKGLTCCKCMEGGAPSARG